MISVDSHIDVPYKHYGTEYRLSEKHGAEFGAVDFPRLREGGINAAVFALYARPWLPAKAANCLAWKQLDWIQGQLSTQEVLVRQPSELRAAVKTGKLAILIALEGGLLIKNDLKELERFARAGACYLTLTHNRNTDWADSSMDAPKHNGLTSFGKDVVRTLNSLSMMVDVSHVSDKTFWDVLGTTKKPVIASHSGCRAKLLHPRNLTDDMLRALAANEGSVQITFARRFSGGTRQDVLLHLQHALEIAGLAHVGIGSDFDGAAMPVDLQDCTQWKNLLVSLPPAARTGIAGGNFLRVWEANWERLGYPRRNGDEENPRRARGV